MIARALAEQSVIMHALEGELWKEDTEKERQTGRSPRMR